MTFVQWMELALLLAGIGHFILLFASFQLPFRLRWKEELVRVSAFNRKLLWTQSGFTVLTIIAFGTLTLLLRQEMLRGDRAAVALAAFMGIYWSCRIAVDAFYFSHDDWPKGRLLAVGHALLTGLFVALAGTYLALAAWQIWFRAGDTQSPLRGYFVAGRPPQFLIQMSSHVRNEEEYLFETESGPSATRLVKVVHKHFGPSSITYEMGEGAVLTDLDVKREPSCDESLHAFVSRESVARAPEPGEIPIPMMRYASRPARANLALAERLDCYVILEDGVKPSTEPP